MHSIWSAFFMYINDEKCAAYAGSTS
jgi:hypothetical protein